MFEGLLPAGWAAGMDNLRVANLTDNSLSGWGGGQLMLYLSHLCLCSVRTVHWMRHESLQ
jgi:hypothetical protein